MPCAPNWEQQERESSVGTLGVFCGHIFEAPCCCHHKLKESLTFSGTNKRKVHILVSFHVYLRLTIHKIRHNYVL
jgi:hypothetical protein